MCLHSELLWINTFCLYLDNIMEGIVEIRQEMASQQLKIPDHLCCRVQMFTGGTVKTS